MDRHAVEDELVARIVLVIQTAVAQRNRSAHLIDLIRLRVGGSEKRTSIPAAGKSKAANATSSSISGADNLTAGAVIVSAAGVVDSLPAFVTAWKTDLPLSLMGMFSELAICSLRWPSSPA